MDTVQTPYEHRTNAVGTQYEHLPRLQQLLQPLWCVPATADSARWLTENPEKNSEKNHEKTHRKNEKNSREDVACHLFPVLSGNSINHLENLDTS